MTETNSCQGTESKKNYALSKKNYSSLRSFLIFFESLSRTSS